jgi:hypothetical protein
VRHAPGGNERSNNVEGGAVEGQDQRGPEGMGAQWQPSGWEHDARVAGFRDPTEPDTELGVIPP